MTIPLKKAFDPVSLIQASFGDSVHRYLNADANFIDKLEHLIRLLTHWVRANKIDEAMRDYENNLKELKERITQYYNPYRDDEASSGKVKQILLHFEQLILKLNNTASGVALDSKKHAVIALLRGTEACVDGIVGNFQQAVLDVSAENNVTYYLAELRRTIIQELNDKYHQGNTHTFKAFIRRLKRYYPLKMDDDTNDHYAPKLTNEQITRFHQGFLLAYSYDRIVEFIIKKINWTLKNAQSSTLEIEKTIASIFALLEIPGSPRTCFESGLIIMEGASPINFSHFLIYLKSKITLYLYRHEVIELSPASLVEFDEDALRELCPFLEKEILVLAFKLALVRGEKEKSDMIQSYLGDSMVLESTKECAFDELLKRGHWTAICFFLESPTIQLTDQQAIRIFAAAIAHNQINVIRRLNGRMKSDSLVFKVHTALTYAVISPHTHVSTLKLLLDMCDVNLTNADGETPLMAACRTGSFDKVVVLLAHPKVDIHRKHGVWMDLPEEEASPAAFSGKKWMGKNKTALEIAFTKADQVTDDIKTLLLLSYQMDAFIHHREWQPPDSAVLYTVEEALCMLYRKAPALFEKFFSQIKEADPSFYALLLRGLLPELLKRDDARLLGILMNGAKDYLDDYAFETLTRQSISLDAAHCLNKLIALLPEKENVIQSAVKENAKKCIALLSASPSIQVTTACFRQLLLSAVAGDVMAMDLFIFEHLLKAAVKELQPSDIEKLWQVACHQKTNDLLKILLANKIPYSQTTPIAEALNHKPIIWENVLFLIEEMTPFNFAAVVHEEQTLVEYAAAEQEWSVVKAIADRYSAGTVDDNHQAHFANMLLMAARSNRWDIVTKCLPITERFDKEVISDKNQYQTLGVDLLTCAIEEGRLDEAKQLLQKGVNPNLPNSRGLTALFIAVSSREYVTSEASDILSLLLQQPAIELSFDCVAAYTYKSDFFMVPSDYLEKPAGPVSPLERFQLAIQTEQVLKSIRESIDKKKPLSLKQDGICKLFFMNNKKVFDNLLERNLPISNARYEYFHKMLNWLAANWPNEYDVLDFDSLPETQTAVRFWEKCDEAYQWLVTTFPESSDVYGFAINFRIQLRNRLLEPLGDSKIAALSPDQIHKAKSELNELAAKPLFRRHRSSFWNHGMTESERQIRSKIEQLEKQEPHQIYTPDASTSA